MNEVNQYLSNIKHKYNIPGIVLGIHSPNQTTFRTYGYSDVASKTKPTKDTMFRVASVTKLVTAILLNYIIKNQNTILKNYTITINDPVLKHVDLKIGTKCLKVWEKVTIKTLLSMSSGINSLDRYYVPYREYIKQCVGRPLEFMPGTMYNYADVNYMILGVILESLPYKDGKLTFSALANKYVFGPLGMNSSYVSTSVHDQGIATPYGKTGKPIPLNALTPPSHSFASGAVVSTAADLLKLGDAILNKTLDIDYSWFSPVVQQMTFLPNCHNVSCYCDSFKSKQLFKNRYYALGCDTSNINNEIVYSKDGGFPGYMAIVYVNTTTKTVITLVANLRVAGLQAHIAERVNFLLNQPTTIESFSTNFSFAAVIVVVLLLLLYHYCYCTITVIVPF